MNEISLHILDIVQNSIEAFATRITIEIIEDAAHDSLTVIITDNGCGMDDKTARSAQEPFTTSRKTRKVGLGLPLFKAGCLACEGKFSVESRPGAGTAVTGSYKMSHIDRPPLGNVADTVYMLVAANPELDFDFRHSAGGEEFSFTTAAVRQALGDVPLDEPDVRQWIRKFLNEAEKDLHGGA
jgi:anti-sigma regulatory factor (Ser/Thr protein kinase)